MNRRFFRMSKGVFIFFLVATMITTPVLAQQNTQDYMQGRMDGERDGKAEASAALWALAGFGCGIFGIGAAFLVEPAVPVGRTIGKSSNYVAGYTDAYKTARKRAQTTWAAVGCAAWGLIYIVIVAASDTYY